MLMRKLAIYEFGCRNILYLMFESLSIFSLYQKILVETICCSEIVKPNTLLRKLRQRKKKTKNNSITVLKFLRAFSRSTTRSSHYLNLVFESVPAFATCSHVFLVILFFIEPFHIRILLFCCCFLLIYACAISSVDQAE